MVSNWLEIDRNPNKKYLNNFINYIPLDQLNEVDMIKPYIG